MLRIKLYDLEYEIEDIKLSYEIMKLTGEKCGFFGKDEVCYSENRILELTDDVSENFYFENDILELTDDLSGISNILKIDGTDSLRVNCKMIDFSSDNKILQDVVEKIMKRGKKCDVLTISSTQNDKKLYFYNYFFTDMMKEYHSNLLKYRFYFDYFYFKQK